jgi:hypothetical protein
MFQESCDVMYKVDLFQYKSQFHYVFNVNPGNQGFRFFLAQFLLLYTYCFISKYTTVTQTVYAYTSWKQNVTLKYNIAVDFLEASDIKYKRLTAIAWCISPIQCYQRPNLHEWVM